MFVCGINAVTEALKAGRVVSLRTSGRRDRRVQQVLALAACAHVPVRRHSDAELDGLAAGVSHQGVVAEVSERERCTLDDLIRDARANPPALIVVLDGIEDPHNFGAIVRTADAAGAHGVVRQTRHAAPLTAAVNKAAAGALAHVNIADVVNVARAIEELKEAGIWTVAMAADASEQYDRIDYTLPTAIVLGAEGGGIRRLVRERCDFGAAIPMRGHVDSLNVSVTAGIVLFEAVRQRRAGNRDPEE